MTSLGDVDALTPPFDTKIAILVRDDLEVWQRLNVTAFLASGIAAGSPHLIGEAYVDGDGAAYLPMLGLPTLVFEASGEVLGQARERAVRREIPTAVYVRAMFSTGYDAANRGTIAQVPSAELELVGLALHGPKSQVDRVVKGARLHH